MNSGLYNHQNRILTGKSIGEFFLIENKQLTENLNKQSHLYIEQLRGNKKILSSIQHTLQQLLRNENFRPTTDIYYNHKIRLTFQLKHNDFGSHILTRELSHITTGNISSVFGDLFYRGQINHNNLSDIQDEPMYEMLYMDFFALPEVLEKTINNNNLQHILFPLFFLIDTVNHGYLHDYTTDSSRCFYQFKTLSQGDILSLHQKQLYQIDIISPHEFSNIQGHYSIMQHIFTDHQKYKAIIINMRSTHLDTITHHPTLDETMRQHLIGIGALFMSRILPYEDRTTQADLSIYQQYVTESRSQNKKSYELKDLLGLNTLLQHNHTLISQGVSMTKRPGLVTYISKKISSQFAKL